MALRQPPLDVIERAVQQAGVIYGRDASFFPSGQREWSAFRRLLDSRLPGYQF